MERLTIEEAIKHEKEVVDMNYNDAEKFDSNDSAENYMKANCMECAEEHEQLAEWLEELKSYKDIGTPKELKKLKGNSAFTGLELVKLAIMQKELKKYKNLEEQGLLVRLPCKVNDKLYHFYDMDFEDNFADVTPDEFISEVIAAEFIIDRHEITIKCITGWNTRYEYLPVVEIGKTVFLTREEAEKKLEEMKKNG